MSSGSLGPLRYEEPVTVVKLSSELAGSLRALQVRVSAVACPVGGSGSPVSYVTCVICHLCHMSPMSYVTCVICHLCHMLPVARGKYSTGPVQEFAEEECNGASQEIHVSSAATFLYMVYCMLQWDVHLLIDNVESTS